MRFVSTIARYLLGAIFLIFGLNGFFHFIPMPAPTGLAGQYMGAQFLSHFLALIFLLQIVSAILLLANRYVAVLLVLLGPVVVNILCFDAFMAPSGLPLAGLVVVLWLLTFAALRPAFAGIFQAHAQEA